MKTTEEVKVLVAAISTDKVSDEQVVMCKEVALQAMTKILSGETVSADEVLVNKYVSTLLSKAVANASKFAETEANKAAAEAEYKVKQQEHKLEVNKLLADWVKAMFNKKGEFIPKVENRDEVKGVLEGFIKTLPAMPKKPNASDTGRTGNTTKGETSTVWNKTVNVSKMKDGSTNKVIWDAICAALEGLTKKELEKLMLDNFAARGIANNKIAVYDATHGKLPLEKVGDKFIAKLEPKPEVELEVVTPEPEK